MFDDDSECDGSGPQEMFEPNRAQNVRNTGSGKKIILDNDDDEDKRKESAAKEKRLAVVRRRVIAFLNPTKYDSDKFDGDNVSSGWTFRH